MKGLHAKTARTTGLYAFGNLSRRGVHFLLLPVYTSYVTTQDFGLWMVLLVTGAVLSELTVTPLLTGGLLRFYYHPAYRDRRGELVFNSSLVLLLLAGVLAGVWLALARPITMLLFGDETLLTAVRLFAAVLLFWPLQLLQVEFLKLRQRSIAFVATSVGEAVVSASVVVTGLVALDLGVEALVLGLAAGMAFTTLVCLPGLLANCRWRLSASVLAGSVRFGLPLLPAGLSRRAMQLGDRYVLLRFVGLGQIGMYGFAYSLAEGIETAVGTPVNESAGPVIRRLEDQPDLQRSFIRRSATMYYLAVVLVALGVAMFSREIVHLLGRRQEYWGAWRVVPLLAMAFALQTLGAFLDWGMTMRNRAGHLSGLLMVAAAMNIGLNILLIPRYGIAGAAAATVITHTLWNAARAYFSARFYALRFDWPRLVAITALGCGLFAVGMLLAPDGPWWRSLAVKLPTAAAFPVLCWVLGLLDDGQKQAMRAAWRTVRTEGIRSAVAKVRAAGEGDE